MLARDVRRALAIGEPSHKTGGSFVQGGSIRRVLGESLFDVAADQLCQRNAVFPSLIAQASCLSVGELDLGPYHDPSVSTAWCDVNVPHPLLSSSNSLRALDESGIQGAGSIPFWSTNSNPLILNGGNQTQIFELEPIAINGGGSTTTHANQPSKLGECNDDRAGAATCAAWVAPLSRPAARREDRSPSRGQPRRGTRQEQRSRTLLRRRCR